MNHRIDRLVKERMIALIHGSITRRLLFIAAPLAVCLVLLFPATASAHAILLRSDPAKDAILRVAPREVRMWFSEDLNPAFSTASVVNASNARASNINAAGQRVDNRDAHVSPSDTKEMDVTLPPNLPPAAYIVLYQTDSAEDGHILRGSFLFYVARPDGSVPTVNANALSGQETQGSNTTPGQLDGPALFNLLMITLVEVGAVFWVGAQMWMIFVLRPVSHDYREERAINQQVQQRFERRFSLPALLVLLLANVGVLVGQALNINVAAAFSPTVIASLASTGRFGTFWTMREIVIEWAELKAARECEGSRAAQEKCIPSMLVSISRMAW
jgi:copper transport protein